MTCNVGGVERPIRIVIGIVLLGIGAFAGLPVEAMAAALVVGTIALVTGAIGYCPLWMLLGLNTCPTAPSQKR
jgi:Inner membrane protein YgaP-like, transmembrane domain